MSESFTQLGIDPMITEQLHADAIREPTEVQKQVIPLILQGNDVQVVSQTGSGKTLAYVLPILQTIDHEQKTLQAVVLVPTQELAMQVTRVAERYAEVCGVGVQALIGGASTKRQLEKLKQHPQFIVGTPGRIAELLSIRKLSLHAVRTIVIDEADRMLTLSGADTVDVILRHALRSRQLLFFSATLPDPIRKLGDERMNAPVMIDIAPETRVAESIRHWYFVTDERDKIDMLRKLVRLIQPESAIAFVNETEDLAEMTAKLQYHGLRAESLYSEAGKRHRAETMRAFRGGKLQLLISTDVTARGLDLDGLTHVFLFDPAPDADHYVHRAGRTGRMGKTGTVISLITPKQRFILDKLSKQLRIVFQEKTMHSGVIAAAVPGESGGRKHAAASGESKARKNAVRRPSSGGKQTPTPEKKKRNSERVRDRKRKGEPKWLKSKNEMRK